tara:strand:+ start:326 stop:1042 length:717 start_codon:yes stop_codon:yes gene_type:complete
VIVFNGCSFVEQSHLDMESAEWKSLYWPALIAPEHINLAQSGASNTRIWRTTIDHIHSGKPITKLCVGWTNITREELPIANGDTLNCLPYSASSNNDPHIDVEDLHKHWYKNHHNDWLSYERLIDYILTIQDACALRKITCYMFNSWDTNNLRIPSKVLPHNFNILNNRMKWRWKEDIARIEQKLSYIDWDQWIWSANTHLIDWIDTNGLECESHGHPNLSAQRPIADYIIDNTNLGR